MLQVIFFAHSISYTKTNLQNKLKKEIKENISSKFKTGMLSENLNEKIKYFVASEHVSF